jgi:hypothetical protein
VSKPTLLGTLKKGGRRFFFIFPIYIITKIFRKIKFSFNTQKDIADNGKRCR